MSEESAAKQNPHKFMGVPRDEIDWYPTIDYDKCNDCGDCVKFCAHGVYEIQDGKVKVIEPKNCVVFCQACLKMCPVPGAMNFQTKAEVLGQIKDIKKKKKESGGE